MAELTKRARQAIEILRRNGGSVHSFRLNDPLHTNFSPRAILEARKAGYIITSTREKLGNAWGVRYRLIEPPKAWTQEKQEEQYTFHGSHMVKIEPPRQEALL